MKVLGAASARRSVTQAASRCRCHRRVFSVPQWGCMTDFICNVCGSRNHVAEFAAEPASCAYGSNVRTRALIDLLSMELFGRNLILADFPRLKSVRALGMSDKEIGRAHV